MDSNITDTVSTRAVVVSASFFETMVLYINGLLGSTVCPVVGFGGVFLNLLVMMFMPGAQGIPKKVRLYYSVIAFFDLIPLVFLHILVGWPVLFSSFTNAKIRLYYFEGSSNFACQISRLIWGSAQAIAVTLGLTFAPERTLVIQYPFYAKSLTMRKTIIAMIIVILFYVILGALLAYPSHGLTRPVYGFSAFCSAKSELFYRMLFLGYQLISVFIPNIALVVVTIIMVVIIRKSIAESKSISAHGKKSSSDINILVILVGMSTIQCAIYVPYGITFIIYNFLTGADGAIFRYLGSYCLILSSFVNATNFFFYFARLPSFRDSMLCKGNKSTKGQPQTKHTTTTTATTTT